MVARRKKGGSRSNWTAAHITTLKTGRDFFDRDFPWFGGVSIRRRYPESVLPRATFRRDTWRKWKRHGRTCAARLWQHGRSRGKRPWAWWLFDSPAPRDSDISQATQLKNLGILKGDELARTPAHDLGPDWWKPVLEYD